jgi:hypothetical protein
MEDGNVVITFFNYSLVHQFPMEMFRFSITFSCDISYFCFFVCILLSIPYKSRDHFLSRCLMEIVLD